MSIDSHINYSLNTIIRRVTGKLQLQDIKDEIEQSLSHPYFQKNMHVVWDMSVAEFDEVKKEEIMELVQFVTHQMNIRGDDFKVALVAPLNTSFNISEMFESYASELPISIRPFRNTEAALEWVKPSSTA